MRNLLFILIFAASCTRVTDKTHEVDDKEWVYIETMYITRNDTTRNYRYGQISREDIGKIKNPDGLNGMFELTDARYIDTSDVVRDYADSRDQGTLYYRYKDVLYFEILKDDPLITEADSTVN